MSAMSNYLENKLVDHLFRTATFAKPLGIYVGLMTVAQNDADGGVEVVGGGYARVSVPPLDANWEATQGGTTGVSSGTTGVTRNMAVLTFPAPTADWGIVVGYQIRDAAVGGNLLTFGLFATSKTVASGDQPPAIAANGLVLTFQ